MADVLQLTVKEYAARERVDPKTVRRWIVKGAVDVRRTPGGGVRILVPSDSRLVFLGTSMDKHGHPSA